jgi:hypothetical protein
LEEATRGLLHNAPQKYRIIAPDSGASDRNATESISEDESLLHGKTAHEIKHYLG